GVVKRVALSVLTPVARFINPRVGVVWHPGQRPVVAVGNHYAPAVGQHRPDLTARTRAPGCPCVRNLHENSVKGRTRHPNSVLLAVCAFGLAGGAPDSEHHSSAHTTDGALASAAIVTPSISVVMHSNSAAVASRPSCSGTIAMISSCTGNTTLPPHLVASHRSRASTSNSRAVP